MKRLTNQRPDVNGIVEGVIWKQLLLFFFPIVLGTFFQQLYNTADAIIVGKVVGRRLPRSAARRARSSACWSASSLAWLPAHP